VDPTRDALFAGELVLWQPARGGGYRFNLDPVLLAGFASPAGHVLDLGAGCGVLGLALLHLGKAERVTAVELQSELADLAERNARENQMVERFEVIRGDLRQVALPTVDSVVFNPPYFRAGEGRAPPETGRNIARHERFGTLADFVSCALAQAGGPVSAIVPAGRAEELRGLVADGGAACVREREVVPRAGEPVGHLLVEARRRDGGSLERMEPLVVHIGSQREYSEEVRALLREVGKL